MPFIDWTPTPDLFPASLWGFDAQHASNTLEADTLGVGGNRIKIAYDLSGNSNPAQDTNTSAGAQGPLLVNGVAVWDAPPQPQAQPLGLSPTVTVPTDGGGMILLAVESVGHGALQSPLGKHTNQRAPFIIGHNGTHYRVRYYNYNESALTPYILETPNQALNTWMLLTWNDGQWRLNGGTWQAMGNSQQSLQIDFLAGVHVYLMLGSIACAMVWDGTATAEEIEKLEGWAAHKFSAEIGSLLLDSGHTYHAQAPQIWQEPPSLTCAGMKLKADGLDDFCLPEGLVLQDNDFSIRHESIPLAYTDGAKLFGDEVQARDVEIAGKLFTETRAGHNAFMAALAARCRVPDQKLYRDPGGTWYMPIRKLKDMRSRYQRGWDRCFTDVQIVWASEDPYWYSESLVAVEFEPTGNAVFTVDPTAQTPAARAWVSPVITITAPVSGSVSSVRLQNLTDGGLQLLYADLQLRNGASAVIDCHNGTVTRGGTNTIQYLAAGSEFIRLLDRPNQVQYTGSACTISFTWRPREL